MVSCSFYSTLLSLGVVVACGGSARGAAPAATPIFCPAADVTAVRVVADEGYVATPSTMDYRLPSLRVSPLIATAVIDGSFTKAFEVTYFVPVHYSSVPEYSLHNLELTRPMTNLTCTEEGFKLSGGLVGYVGIRIMAIPNTYRVQLDVVPHRPFVTVEASWPIRDLDRTGRGAFGTKEWHDAPWRLVETPQLGSGDPIRMKIDVEALFRAPLR